MNYRQTHQPHFCGFRLDGKNGGSGSDRSDRTPAYTRHARARVCACAPARREYPNVLSDLSDSGFEAGQPGRAIKSLSPGPTNRVGQHARVFKLRSKFSRPTRPINSRPSDILSGKRAAFLEFHRHKSCARSSIYSNCFPANGAAMMAEARTYAAACATCGATFEGVVGPGRRERFCSDACRAVAIKKSRLRSAPAVGAGGSYAARCAVCNCAFDAEMGERGRRRMVCSAACRRVQQRRWNAKIRLARRTEVRGPLLPLDELPE